MRNVIVYLEDAHLVVWFNFDEKERRCFPAPVVLLFVSEFPLTIVLWKVDGYR